MLRMRQSHVFLALSFNVVCFFSYIHTNNMGKILSFFKVALRPYFNLIDFHASFIGFLLITSNLLFYLLYSHFVSS